VGAVALIGLLVAACGDATTSTTPGVSPPVSASEAPSEAPPSDEPPASAAPSPGDQPSSPVPSEPGAAPSEEPTPSASGGPAGPAGACSGSEGNREFFADAAARMAWDVYCPVFPEGWFVDVGTYRLAGGGRLEIAYKGPAGARFELREGAFCEDPSGCVPSGTEIGGAPFGDRIGTLIATDDGGYALVVDRGQPVSWMAIDHGLDEATFREFCAALQIVAA
jgi:hypothetical protein